MNMNMKRVATLALAGAMTCGVAIAVGEKPFDSAAFAGPGNSGNNGANGNHGNGPAGAGNSGAHNDKGEIAAAAGALNAAHASANARAHASPTSRVGLIAEFEKERLGLIAARDLTAQAVLDLQTELAELQAAKEVLDNQLSYTQDQIDAANATLAQYGVTNGAELDARIAAIPGEITTAEAEALLAQQALDDPAAQIASLEPAANKDVTMDVVEAVKGWLGLSE
jgi:uncharacterized small protein (DUF1192 family)